MGTLKKVLAILGPTATGKTDLALDLAKKFNGELISCDSRQVYKDLDILTGKLPYNTKHVTIEKFPGHWIIDGINIWMYDVTDLNTQYSVYDYQKVVEKVLLKIFASGKLPILVGGTGLYFKAILEDLSYIKVSLNRELRSELENLSLNKLQDRLKELSLEKWESLNESDRKNPRRLLRSIELISMNPYIKPGINSSDKKIKFNCLKIGLNAPRQLLYKKINSRGLIWLDLGVIKEVENLLNQGISPQRIKDLGLGYRDILEHLESGSQDLDKLIDKLQTKTRQYAKRQLTWFRKETNIHWFDITELGYLEKVETMVRAWYNEVDGKAAN